MINLEGKAYTAKDLEDSLRRAFVDNRMPTILWDGHENRNPFLRDGITHGFDQGWLCVESEINESQYTAINYKLTDKGRKYFGVK